MKTIVLAGVLIAVGIVLFSPFASQSPDGLEKVAEDKGFLHKSEGQKIFNAPIPDYVLPGVKNEVIATSVAGLVGTLISFCVAFGLGYILKRMKKRGTFIFR